MKTFFLLFGAIVLCSSCQKELTERQASSTLPGEFNSKVAQDWYNNTFKNSAEFTGYDALKKGNKEPNWNKSNYRKNGHLELIEFPLTQQRRTISMPMDSTLTQSQIKEILSSSHTTIVFLKNARNEIFIRERDYVPTYSYVTSKDFSLSDVRLGSAGKNFTGTVITKNWNGKRISVQRLQAGKVKGTSIIKSSTNKNRVAPTTTL